MASILGQLFCSGRLVQASASPCGIPTMHLHQKTAPHSGKTSSWSHSDLSSVPSNSWQNQEVRVGAGCVKVQARGCLSTAPLLCPILWSSPPHPNPCSSFVGSHADSKTSHIWEWWAGQETVRGTGEAPGLLQQWREGSFESSQTPGMNVRLPPLPSLLLEYCAFPPLQGFVV